MTESLIHALVEMQEIEALKEARRLLDEGADPMSILESCSKAMETGGKVACLAGKVPLDLLCTGTPDEVKTYCRELIDVAGAVGGFILSTGAGMQGSKAANVKAMMDFAKEYGVYK
jgi:uroporphyrinogen-III decarboxylase